MARWRALHKGISTSLRFVTLEEWEQLLFTLMLAHTDDFGRLPGDPFAIKLKCCPASARTPDEILGALTKMAEPKHNLITRYETDGVEVVQMHEFDALQPSEVIRKRTSPKYPDQTDSSCTLPGSSAEMAGKLPSSGRPKEKKSKVEQSKGKKRTTLSPGVPATPHEEILAAYHEILPMLPRVRLWTDARKKLLNTRWREDPGRQSVDSWRKFFQMVSKCPHLLGENDRQWKASLPWLLELKNFAKVLEGNYYKPQNTERQLLGDKASRTAANARLALGLEE